MSLSKLTDILDKKGISETNPLIPMVGVKASQTGNQHPAEAKYIPSEKSLGISRTGWGHFPLLENIGPDRIEYPDSEDLREELFMELTRASGHTNKAEVWKFYPTPVQMGE